MKVKKDKRNRKKNKPASKRPVPEVGLTLGDWVGALLIVVSSPCFFFFLQGLRQSRGRVISCSRLVRLVEALRIRR